MTLEAGQKVQIVIADDSPLHGCVWWPKGEITGTVQKIFKNGKVAVAVHQIRNEAKSKTADGYKTLHFGNSNTKLIPIS